MERRHHLRRAHAGAAPAPARPPRRTRRGQGLIMAMSFAGAHISSASARRSPPSRSPSSLAATRAELRRQHGPDRHLVAGARPAIFLRPPPRLHHRVADLARRPRQSPLLAFGDILGKSQRNLPGGSKSRRNVEFATGPGSPCRSSSAALSSSAPRTSACSPTPASTCCSRSASTSPSA
jgi:hypothetical protein